MREQILNKLKELSNGLQFDDSKYIDGKELTALSRLLLADASKSSYNFDEAEFENIRFYKISTSPIFEYDWKTQKRIMTKPGVSPKVIEKLIELSDVYFFTTRTTDNEIKLAIAGSYFENIIALGLNINQVIEKIIQQIGE